MQAIDEHCLSALAAMLTIRWYENSWKSPENQYVETISGLRRFPNSLIPPELVFLPIFCVVETRT